VSAEQQQAEAARAALVQALRAGRDTFQMPIFPGGFSNELAQAIELVVEARIAVREREILAHLDRIFPEEAAC